MLPRRLSREVRRTCDLDELSDMEELKATAAVSPSSGLDSCCFSKQLFILPKLARTNFAACACVHRHVYVSCRWVQVTL